MIDQFIETMHDDRLSYGENCMKDQFLETMHDDRLSYWDNCMIYQFIETMKNDSLFSRGNALVDLGLRMKTAIGVIYSLLIVCGKFDGK